jgi:hypothetical protein
VAHNAVKYVTQTFSAMREARLATHAADLKSIPYYHIYEQYKGRPPLHPQYVAAIQRQIQQADFDLRRNIDSDWRSCVLRYPEVLGHFFSLIQVTIPKDIEEPTSVIPTVPAFLPSPPLGSTKTKSVAGSNTGAKKARRVSLNMAPKANEEKEEQHSLESIAKLLQGQNFSLGGLPSGLGGGFKGLGGGTKGLGASKAGRGSPAFDTSSKAGGKKKLQQEFMLSGKRGGFPRAPTAPPTSQSAWKLPGAI